RRATPGAAARVALERIAGCPEPEAVSGVADGGVGGQHDASREGEATARVGLVAFVSGRVLVERVGSAADVEAPAGVRESIDLLEEVGVAGRVDSVAAVALALVAGVDFIALVAVPGELQPVGPVAEDVGVGHVVAVTLDLQPYAAVVAARAVVHDVVVSLDPDAGAAVRAVGVAHIAAVALDEPARRSVGGVQVHDEDPL